jgi:toxin ParE1/3/4
VLRWYANISPQLSQRYAQAVDNTVQLIAEHPLRFPIVQKERRRAGVRLFPYGLFYLVEDSRIVVIACFHGKRNPQHWQSR